MSADPAAEVTDVIPRVTEPGNVPVQVFDTTGSLLLVTEAVPTHHQPAPADDGDLLQKIVNGRELPDSGPTVLPTLTRHLSPPKEPEAPEAPEPADVPPDAPSGSALSTVDMAALFGVPADRPTALNAW